MLKSAFELTMQSIQISAQVLPSLRYALTYLLLEKSNKWKNYANRVTYRMDKAHSEGTTGADSRFCVAVRNHYITFVVKEDDQLSNSEIAPIKLDLPMLRAEGFFILVILYKIFWLIFLFFIGMLNLGFTFFIDKA